MRLIDADKLRCKDMVDGMLDVFDVLEAPTVEAIPVEWLYDIMKKQLIFATTSEMEGTTTVQDGVIHCVSGALACQVVVNVIKLWEKENEGRDHNSK